MITIEKFCGVLELKWGILIIAIVDLLLCSMGCGVSGILEYFKLWYFLTYLTYVAHIVGCLMMLVSVFVPKAWLVICYLVTCIIRFIVVILVIIWQIIKGVNVTEMYVVEALILLVSVYFFLCAFSWYKKLGS